MIEMANAITCLRILLSLVLLRLKFLSFPFYTLYVLCGLTDIADGYIARKTHTQSARGARLDSIADMVFVAICAIRFVPTLTLKPWIWGLIAVILLVKLTNLVCGFVLQKKLCFLHTTANRLTGLMLFVLPLTVRFVAVNIAAVPVCIVALFAAVQEGHFIRTEKNLDADRTAATEKVKKDE